jgi:calnexin
MGAIGFEIWTMQSDILFDNIYIGHSIEEAQKFADETFFEKHPIEQLLELESKPKDDDKPIKSPSDLVFMDDPVHYIREKLDLFLTIAQNDPIQAIKFVPEAAAGIGAVLVTLIAIIVGVVSMSGASAPPQVKKAAEKAKATATDAKDKVAEAVASGTDAAKAEVNKRTTRSTS